MTNIQMKAPLAAAGPGGGGSMPQQAGPGQKPQSPRSDLGFAIKLFGIAGLVVFVIWWMNRAVS